MEKIHMWATALLIESKLVFNNTKECVTGSQPTRRYEEYSTVRSDVSDDGRLLRDPYITQVTVRI